MIDEEKELLLLGALLESEDILTTLSEISEYTSDIDFNNSEYRNMFQTIKTMAENGETPNSVNLSSKGVQPMLIANAIANSLTSSTSVVKSLSKSINDMAKKRRLFQMSENMMKQIANGRDYELVEKELNDFIDSQKKDSKMRDSKNAKEVAEETYQNIVDHIGQKRALGNLTGFKNLDNSLGGLMDGTLTIVAARPAMGKSAFSINVAEGIADKNDKPVLLINLEMSNDMTMKRMLAKNSMIDAEKIRDSKLDGTDVQILGNAVEQISDKKIIFSDTPNQTITDIRNRALKTQREYGQLGLVVVDYLGLIVTDDSKGSNRVNEISKISRGLKLLSKELNAPIIALSQLNRGVENRQDKRPMLSDLRDSGSIEQDADCVIFLHREDYFNSDDQIQEDNGISDTEFIIAKNRNGRRGTINVSFDKKHNVFEEKNNQW